MKKTHYKIQFASFSPIFVWEWNAENAIIRAKYQRLEEGLSTAVVSVHRENGHGTWNDCGMTDFVPQRSAA